MIKIMARYGRYVKKDMLLFIILLISANAPYICSYFACSARCEMSKRKQVLQNWKKWRHTNFLSFSMYNKPKDTTESKANIVAKVIKIVCMQMTRSLTIEMTEISANQTLDDGI